MSQKGTHLCEGNISNTSTIKKSQQNNEMSILEGLYMDYISPLKIEYEFLFHNVFIQCFWNFGT
jgi:hypothetical protein